MDDQRFEAACRSVIGVERERRGIGTLGEKTLHAVLKNYYQPDRSKQEIKIGSFFADIAEEGRITEIQTGSFNALCKKLDQMLISYKVTVVYPIAAVKYVCWIDPERGEVISRKKSPKKGNIYESLKELYYIRDMLGDPNLTVRLLLLELDEYRLLDGWGKDRKNRATKYEKVPLRLISETDLSDKRDYMMLLPPSLPERFTAKELGKALRFSSIASYGAIKTFLATGCIIPDGKVDRAAAYRIADGMN